MTMYVALSTFTSSLAVIYNVLSNCSCGSIAGWVTVLKYEKVNTLPHFS